jgi:hypothetical protein
MRDPPFSRVGSVIRPEAVRYTDDGAGKVLSSPSTVGERSLFERQLLNGATAREKQFRNQSFNREAKVRGEPPRIGPNVITARRYMWIKGSPLDFNK